MKDLLGAALGILVGASLSAVLLGLAASVPWAMGTVFIVLFRREGLPVIYHLRSLFRRRLTTSATLAGLALVTFVLTSALMLAGGIRRTMVSTGDPLVLKIMADGATTEAVSDIPLEQVQILAAASEAALDRKGKPLVSPELVAVTLATRVDAKSADDATSLAVRGISEAAFEMRSGIRVEGRLFSSGQDEILIGRALVGRFKGAEVGGRMPFSGREWTVVGVADHGGSAHDSEIWGDFQQVATAFRRRETVVNIAVKDDDALRALSQRIDSDPQLNSLSGRRETAYWSQLSSSNVRFVTVLGIIVAVLFSFGAVLGAMNTMYAQVAARAQEIGTLRSIGFQPRAILTSLLLESLLLALVSGAVGVAGAAIILDGVQFSLTSEGILNEISYAFHLTRGAALGCLGFACLMGYAGGLLPALRAARMPVSMAIRAR